MNTKKNQRYEIFNSCYDIIGDGISQLKLEEAIKNDLFQKTVKEMMELDIRQVRTPER